MPKAAIAAALSIPALKRRGFSRIWITYFVLLFEHCFCFFVRLKVSIIINSVYAF